MKYIANAFSLQMVGEREYKLAVSVIDSLPKGLTSAIGHADTAHVLGYEPNRISISLTKDDILYVAQLVGGRLPEGTTSLPDGFKFVFYKIQIV